MSYLTEASGLEVSAVGMKVATIAEKWITRGSVLCNFSAVLANFIHHEVILLKLIMQYISKIYQIIDIIGKFLGLNRSAIEEP